jgi:hypothetical protein
MRETPRYQDSHEALLLCHTAIKTGVAIATKRHVAGGAGVSILRRRRYPTWLTKGDYNNCYPIRLEYSGSVASRDPSL